jgi:hypothetical protein
MEEKKLQIDPARFRRFLKKFSDEDKLIMYRILAEDIPWKLMAQECERLAEVLEKKVLESDWT